MLKSVLKVFKEIVKKGHVPCRYKEAYSLYHADLVNCFEHACFNLSEDELSKLYEAEFKYRPLDFLSAPSAEKTCENCLDFLVDAGLKVSQKTPSILKKNQWIVSLYFIEDMSDFHFLLKEKNGLWTAKRGFTQIVDTFEEDSGVIYAEPCGSPYYKEASYVITNKYAEK